MSKFDGEIRARGDAVAPDDVLMALGRMPRDGAGRTDALAHFLSGGEGWRDARAALHGAFATDTLDAAGLTGNSNK